MSVKLSQKFPAGFETKGIFVIEEVLKSALIVRGARCDC